jgi:hypothetical protein
MREKMKTLRMLLVLFVGTLWLGLPAVCVSQQTSLSTGTETTFNHAGELTVVIPLLNASPLNASNLTVTSAVLGTIGSTTSPMPIRLARLNSFGQVPLTLKFNLPANTSGTKSLLTLRGTVTLNGTTSGFALNRFIPIPPALGSQDTFAIYGNKNDPGIVHAELAQGQVVDFFGTKDAAGHALSVQYSRVLSSDGVTQYWFDGTGRPSSVFFPNGMIWSFQWRSNTAAVIAATSSDAIVQVATFVDFAAGTVTPVATPSLAASLTKKLVQGLAAPSILKLSGLTPPPTPSRVATVNVTTCGLPENNATVVTNVGWVLSGRQSLPTPRTGVDGQYSLQVPTPDQNVQDDTNGKAQAAAQALTAKEPRGYSQNGSAEH